jgi:hypothetical protein
VVRLEGSAAGGERKADFATNTFEIEKFMLYHSLSAGSEPARLAPRGTTKGVPVRRFEPGLSREEFFLFESALTH